MLHDRVTLSFKGFHPSENTKKLMNDLVEEVMTEGPSFSKVKAHVLQEGEGDHVLYKGIIELFSNAGSFFVKAESTQILDLTHKLLKRTRKQFSKWKENRHGDRQKIHHAEFIKAEDVL
jgi:hypothetical protein